MRDSEPACCQIDANVILRYIVRDDADHFRKAQRIFSALEQGELEVECDPVTLGEVVWTLKSFYKITRADIAAGLVPLLHSPSFRMPNKDRYLHALKLFAESVTSFGDACCCAAAQEKCQGRLFSFDRDLSSVPGVDRTEDVGNLTTE